MTASLKEKTGVDPLTIDQTVLNQIGATELALYAAIAPRLPPRSSVLIGQKGPLVLGRLSGVVDLQVAHALNHASDYGQRWLRQ